MNASNQPPATAEPPLLVAVPAEVMVDVAAYFSVLSEPSRLQLLNALRSGDFSVGDLAERCGLSAATVSRHLSLMAQHGFVERTARGTSVYYRISDPSIDALCDLVCTRIAQRWEHERQRREAAGLSAQASAGNLFPTTS